MRRDKTLKVCANHLGMFSAFKSIILDERNAEGDMGHHEYGDPVRRVVWCGVVRAPSRSRGRCDGSGRVGIPGISTRRVGKGFVNVSTLMAHANS